MGLELQLAQWSLMPKLVQLKNEGREYSSRVRRSALPSYKERGKKRENLSKSQFTQSNLDTWLLPHHGEIW